MRYLKSFGWALIASLLLLSSCEKQEELKVGFTYSPVSPKVNQEVHFTSTSENATAYAWSFGDGAVSAAKNTAHIYTQAGTYAVVLTVSNEDAETKSITKNITVTSNGGGSTPQGPVVEHNGSIDADEFWSNQSVHVITGNVYVNEATLTIEQGAVVKFNDDAELLIGYSSNLTHSQLIAKGTEEQHITFTANKDNPEQGTWEAIVFGENASSESVMEYCDVSYGGSYNSTSASVIIDGSHIDFNHNTVTHSASKGIGCKDGGHFNSFTNNVVNQNTGSSMSIEANYVYTLGEGNQIANTKNGINVMGSVVDLPGDFVWKNQGAKYTIWSDINVGSENGTSLTIEKGITVAFREDTELMVGYYDNKLGKLTAVGTETEPIRFISAKVNPTPGDWDMIYFGEFNDPASKMEYCEIDAGGGYNSSSSSVRVSKTKISFDNCKVTNSASFGIDLPNEGSFVSFTGNTISNSVQSSMKISAQWAHTIGLNNNIANDGFGISIYGDFNHQNKTFTWLKQTCPYTLVQDMEIGSPQGCTLIIEAGTTIKAAKDIELDVAYSDNKSGALIAKGTADNKITFTSATPTGDWDGIWFSQGTMNTSIMEYCDVINSGAYNSSSGAINCKRINLGNTPTIKNCHIANSKAYGIYIYDASPILENNTFDGNTKEDVYNDN